MLAKKAPPAPEPKCRASHSAARCARFRLFARSRKTRWRLVWGGGPRLGGTGSGRRRWSWRGGSLKKLVQDVNLRRAGCFGSHGSFGIATPLFCQLHPGRAHYRGPERRAPQPPPCPPPASAILSFLTNLPLPHDLPPPSLPIPQSCEQSARYGYPDRSGGRTVAGAGFRQDRASIRRGCGDGAPGVIYFIHNMYV